MVIPIGQRQVRRQQRRLARHAADIFLKEHEGEIYDPGAVMRTIRRRGIFIITHRIPGIDNAQYVHPEIDGGDPIIQHCLADSERTQARKLAHECLHDILMSSTTDSIFGDPRQHFYIGDAGGYREAVVTLAEALIYKKRAAISRSGSSAI